jgi:hypothetical protein
METRKQPALHTKSVVQQYIALLVCNNLQTVSLQRHHVLQVTLLPGPACSMRRAAATPCHGSQRTCALLHS